MLQVKRFPRKLRSLLVAILLLRSFKDLLQSFLLLVENVDLKAFASGFGNQKHPEHFSLATVTEVAAELNSTTAGYRKTLVFARCDSYEHLGVGNRASTKLNTPAGAHSAVGA